MRVWNLIEELKKFDKNEFIAVSYWTQEDIQSNFLGEDEQLSNDEWEEVTDDMTYELEDFSPDVMKEFFDDTIETIRKRKERHERKVRSNN